MKKLFLFLMVFGLMSISFTQQKIPVISDIAYFYADSISTTIEIGKNEFITQIWIDAGRTATIFPEVYNAVKDAWYLLDNDDAKYIITIADSSENYLIPLKPVRFNSIKTVRFVIDNDPTDTLTMPYEKRPY